MASDLSILLPELTLLAVSLAAWAYVAGAGQDRLTGRLTWLMVGVMLFLALVIGLSAGGSRAAFDQLFISDPFARFTKPVLLSSAAVTLIIGHTYLRRYDQGRFEYPCLVGIALVGMMVMVSAVDLITLFLGLELQSIALYIIAVLHRDTARNAEAGLKFFVFGVLSSAVMLFGASLIYGFAGATSFDGILAAVEEAPQNGLLIGLALMLAGLAVRLALAPFHMWAPDVVQGLPTPYAIFFVTAPVLAVMAVMARLLHGAFAGAVPDWQIPLAAVAALSMLLGAFAASAQRDLKRLMAYAAISHIGFALMGLAAGSAAGVEAMLVYLMIYLVMMTGTFAFILTMRRDDRQLTTIDALSGLAQVRPGHAAALLILFLSLAGLPPLLGFFAKLTVLIAAVEAGLLWLAVLGGLASLVAVYAYLRPVYLLYFGEEEDEPIERRMDLLPYFGLMAAAAILVLGLINLFGIEGPAAAAAAAIAG